MGDRRCGDQCMEDKKTEEISRRGRKRNDNRTEEYKDTAGTKGRKEEKLFSPPGICAGLIIIYYKNLIVSFLVYFQASVTVKQ